VDEVEISFEVPKSFASGKNVYLATLAGADWRELPTDKTGETDGSISYSATTTHLSTFAILGEEAVFGFPTAAFTGISGDISSGALILISIMIVLFAYMYRVGKLHKPRLPKKSKPQIHRTFSRPQQREEGSPHGDKSPDFGF
jgi:hypothetical protein